MWYSQVLKAFKHAGSEVNHILRYEKMLTSHTVAKFLAKEYSAALDVLLGPGVGDRLEYLDSCIVRYKNGGHNEFRYESYRTISLVSMQ